MSAITPTYNPTPALTLDPLTGIVTVTGNPADALAVGLVLNGVAGAPWQLLGGWMKPEGGGPALATFDLLELTIPQMAAIMGLTFDVNGDALPTDSPGWSKPGMWFDGIDAAAESWRYTCGRRRYLAGDTTSGVGPAWSRFLKLQQ